jgi:hypothetical protein
MVTAMHVLKQKRWRNKTAVLPSLNNHSVNNNKNIWTILETLYAIMRWLLIF